MGVKMVTYFIVWCSAVKKKGTNEWDVNKSKEFGWRYHCLIQYDTIVGILLMFPLERYFWVGQRPPRPPQILWNGCRSPQCQSGLLLLPRWLAAGPQTSRCHREGPEAGFVRLEGRQSCDVPEEVSKRSLLALRGWKWVWSVWFLLQKKQVHLR